MKTRNAEGAGVAQWAQINKARFARNSSPRPRRNFCAFRVKIILLVACCLAGCTVGPDFVKPKAELPPTWTKAAGAPVKGRISAAAPQTDSWWENFHDPELSALIAKAASDNLDLKDAAVRIAEARAQRDIAAAAELPTLAGNASYSNQRISETTAEGSLFSSIGSAGKGLPTHTPSFPNPYNQYQIGFDASWEPDLFGGVRRSVEAAKADTEASEEDARDSLVSLEGEVARDYIDLRSAQTQLAVVNRNLATEHDVLVLAEQRHAAGLGTDLDVTNAAAQMKQTESQLPPLQAQIASDINQLSQLLAREPGALSGELETAKPVPPVPAEAKIGLPGDLLRHRPDIRAAEARLHAATARVGVADAALFPSISFDVPFGVQSQTPLHLAEWASRFYTIGPTLQLPIFEGGKLKANIMLSDMQEKQAAIDYARTVLNAVHEVENAIVAYTNEQKRRDSLTATLAQNKDALALARQRYRSGVTTFLDVLDAERTAEQTELTLAASNATVSTDFVALYKALGGGWAAEEQDASLDSPSAKP